MGIIKDSNESLLTLLKQFISAEDAIKYLARIEQVSYSEVAKFLMRNKFDERVARDSYEKRLDGSFYNADVDIDFDGDGIFYSSPTRNFLRHVALFNTLEEKDLLLGTSNPFNLYFRKVMFKKIITDLLTEDVPPISETIAQIKQEEGQTTERLQIYKIQSLKAQSNQQLHQPQTINNEEKTLNEAPQTLKLANQAFKRFWGNANPIERDTQPNNADIANWIIEQSDKQITLTMAMKIAQIIRPEWAGIGRKPEK